MGPIVVPMRAWLYALGCALLLDVCSATRSFLRSGEAKQASGQEKEVPDRGSPRWFGHTFNDSPVAKNPYVSPRPVPEAIVGDLDPVAPLDRLDKTWIDTLTGTAQLGPHEHPSTAKGYTAPMKPDWVPPYHRPRTFPADKAPPAASEQKLPVMPLDEKHVVPKMDRLRPAYGTYDSVYSRAVSPLNNYPLTAPQNRLARHLAAAGDQIPEDMRRFAEQVQGRKERLEAHQREEQTFNATDLNQDGGISPAEFDTAMEGVQNKSTEEGDRLWGKYHSLPGTAMSRGEFRRLARTGFDLGAINRTDVAAILVPPGVAAQGFWGSGASCPSNQYVTGARLKVMANTIGTDNTGLNAVGLRCSDGSEVQSIEGPDGTWTEWSDCLPGQRVYGFRVQAQAGLPVGDRTGLNGVEFLCRTPDLGSFSKLQFHAAAPSVGVVSSGWSPELMCPARDAVCGLQANVLRDQGAGDDMGVTDLRVYCCGVKVDCTQVCAGEKTTLQCAVCRQVQNPGR